MKIRLTVPTMGELFTHDSPLYQIIKVALPAFILISSITVFGGVGAYLGARMASSAWYVAWPAYGLGYMLFSLAPDMLNAVLVAYVVRSLLKGLAWRNHGFWLTVCSLGLIIFLTTYSYRMSQTSATAGATALSKQTEAANTEGIDRTYAQKERTLLNDFASEKEEVQKDYRESLALINAKYDNLVKPHQVRILKLEKDRKDSNTQFTDREIRKANSEITAINEKRIAQQEAALKKKEGKIDDIDNRRKSQHATLLDNKKQARNEEISLKKGTNKEINELNENFKGEFKKIAKFAVFIILILSSLREIIHFRSDIEPMPILNGFDFQFRWLSEVLMLPFVKAQRHLVNAVRRVYANLPELEEAEPMPEIIRLKPDQNIIDEDEKKRLSVAAKADTTFFRRGMKGEDLKAHKEHTEITADDTRKKHTKTHETDTRKKHTKITAERKAEINLARRRLGEYKKRLAKHKTNKRLAIKKGKAPTQRTLDAIKNNEDWIDHYTKIINGNK